MRMDINKAGSDDTICRVNPVFGITAHSADRYDAVGLNANISGKSRLATAVDDCAITDDEIVRHTSSLHVKMPLTLSLSRKGRGNL
jgi:hypothetical protein